MSPKKNKVALVRTPYSGERVIRADDYECEAGVLDLYRGEECIATFMPGEWTWIEMQDRPPTNARPSHPRRERTSDEQAVVRPIREADEGQS